MLKIRFKPYFTSYNRKQKILLNLMGNLIKNKFSIILIRIIFLIWVIAIAVFSSVPYPGSNGVASKSLFSSSMAEVHFIAYFIGAVLCYYALKFEGIAFIFLSGFSVFACGVALEIVQILLPYRTFNPVDIVANVFGIVAFVFIWSIFDCFVRKKSSEESEIFRH